MDDVMISMYGVLLTIMDLIMDLYINLILPGILSCDGSIALEVGVKSLDAESRVRARCRAASIHLSIFKGQRCLTMSRQSLNVTF